MIPISVRMKGWLRYRDEQVADFSDGRLIAICGENGAGKSSIFDAITFALYGQHRLGRQNHADLISQDMDSLSVDFEFEADGQRYLVHRGRVRGQGGGSQSMHVWDGGARDWIAVPGTEREEGLKRTIDQVLRLSSEAFLSSFMLQQGAATEFLDAQPQDRFKIVSSLIGLKEYERLEKKAKEEQKLDRQHLEDLDEKLKGFDGVDDGALARLRNERAAVAAAEGAALAGREDARVRHAGALTFTRLSREIAALDSQIAEAASLLAERESIERDAALFDNLSRTVDTLRNIEGALAAAAHAERDAAGAARRADAIDVEAMQRAYEAAAASARDAAEAHDRADAACGRARATERSTHAFAAEAKAVLDGRAEIAKIDARISGYGQQLAELSSVEEQARSLRAVAAALPELRALKAAREAVEKLGRDDPDAALATLQAERKQLEQQAKALANEAEATEKQLALANRAASDAQARAAMLGQQIEQRKLAAAEARCSRCGAPIDKASARAEIKELTAGLQQAQHQASAAQQAARAAEAARGDALARQKRHADASAALAARVAKVEAQRDSLADALARDATHLASFIQSAPAALTSKVDATTPSAAMVKLIAANGGVPERAKGCEKQLAELRGLEGRRSTESETRQRLAGELAAREKGLGKRLRDVEAASDAHDQASRALKDAEGSLNLAREALKDTQATERAATTALTDAREQRARLLSEAERGREAATGQRKAAEAYASGLVAALLDAALRDPEAALRDVEAQRAALANAPERKAALETATTNHATWTGQRGAMLDEVGRIPEAHRMDASAAAAALADAERAAAGASAAREAAQHAVTLLEARMDELRRYRAGHERLSARLKLLRKLVRLLGKQGLQGALVNTALHDITEHANAFLHRLTGGSLQLDLKRGEGDALDLQAVDHDCMREPRSVQALSGSQKFRCAVAIASGIGQYAGAGGMRSIVIDEGFGSLDQDGQHQMVEELKNLAAHMDKVIVVSHLEMFTDRDNFPDQILVARCGTGSRITRAF